jgi:hypothetical protein
VSLSVFGNHTFQKRTCPKKSAGIWLKSRKAEHRSVHGVIRQPTWDNGAHFMLLALGDLRLFKHVVKELSVATDLTIH